MGLFKSKEQKAREAEEKQAAVAAAMAKQHQRDVDFISIMADFAKGEFAFGQETTILLKAGETVLLTLPNVTLIEPKAIRRGAYGGPRIRIAKGLTVGGGVSRYESHDELKMIDRGDFTLTDRRIVFSGGLRTQVIALNKIVSIETHGDGVGINHTSKQKTQYFSFPEVRADFVVGDNKYDSEPISPQMWTALLEGVVQRAPG